MEGIIFGGRNANGFQPRSIPLATAQIHSEDGLAQHMDMAEAAHNLTKIDETVAGLSAANIRGNDEALLLLGKMCGITRLIQQRGGEIEMLEARRRAIVGYLMEINTEATERHREQNAALERAQREGHGDAAGPDNGGVAGNLGRNRATPLLHEPVLDGEDVTP